MTWYGFGLWVGCYGCPDIEPEGIVPSNGNDGQRAVQKLDMGHERPQKVDMSQVQQHSKMFEQNIVANQHIYHFTLTRSMGVSWWQT
jgi:hypothetical protein